MGDVSTQTCLSPRVWKMICETGVSENTEDILTKTLTIDTVRLKGVLDSCEGARMLSLPLWCVCYDSTGDENLDMIRVCWSPNQSV
ncbi:hypothetical protein MRX96_049810 [Rhipicephalus microplus]